MIVKAWPEFTPGEAYATEYVVERLRYHLVHHKPRPPQNPVEKEERTRIIEKCGHETIVFMPGDKWGRSGWNANCWETLDGDPIAPDTTVPRGL